MVLEGKVALITGGSKGIGLAIARSFAKAGAAVAIVARGAAAAEEAVEAMTASGAKAAAFSADCSNVADIERVVGEVAAKFGGLDIVVGNAGSFITKSVAETTEEDWDQQVDLNLKGSFFLVKSALPHFEARGGGKVIFISSIAGLRGFPNCPAYCASKGGVVNMTKAMASELAAKRINVNSIAPGNTATDINEALRGPDQADYIKLMRDKTPTGRAFLDVDDMTGAALFLASDASSGVHGTTVIVDDGWCAW